MVYEITKLDYKLSFQTVSTREYYDKVLKLLVPDLEVMLEMRKKHTFLYHQYRNSVEDEEETHNKIVKKLTVVLSVIKPFYSKYREEDNKQRATAIHTTTVLDAPIVGVSDNTLIDICEEFPYKVLTDEESKKMKEFLNLEKEKKLKEKLELEKEKQLEAKRKKIEENEKLAKMKEEENNYIKNLPKERIFIKEEQNLCIQADPIVELCIYYRMVDNVQIQELNVTEGASDAYFNILSNFNRHISHIKLKNSSFIKKIIFIIDNIIDDAMNKVLGIKMKELKFSKEYKFKTGFENLGVLKNALLLSEKMELSEDKLKNITRDVTPFVIDFFKIVLEDIGIKKIEIDVQIFYILAKSLKTAIMLSPFFLVPTMHFIPMNLSFWVDFPLIDLKNNDEINKLGRVKILGVTLRQTDKFAGKISPEDVVPKQNNEGKTILDFTNIEILLETAGNKKYIYITNNNYAVHLKYLCTKMLATVDSLCANYSTLSEIGGVLMECVKYQIFLFYRLDCFCFKNGKSELMSLDNLNKHLYAIYTNWLFFGGGLYIIHFLPKFADNDSLLDIGSLLVAGIFAKITAEIISKKQKI